MTSLHIMARAPVPGRCKSRLAADLSALLAARIYRAMLRHTLDEAARAGYTHTAVWVHQGDRWHPAIPRTARVQAGGGLGRRMAAILDNHAPCVLIGSDCPALRAAHLRQARLALHDHDVVLGPAADGGYYLIGVRRAQPGLFRAMGWSHPSVLAETLRRLRRRRLRVALLPTLTDVDRAADLQSPIHALLRASLVRGDGSA